MRRALAVFLAGVGLGAAAGIGGLTAYLCVLAEDQVDRLDRRIDSVERTVYGIERWRWGGRA